MPRICTANDEHAYIFEAKKSFSFIGPCVVYSRLSRLTLWWTLEEMANDDQKFSSSGLTNQTCKARKAHIPSPIAWTTMCSTYIVQFEKGIKYTITNVQKLCESTCEADHTRLNSICPQVWQWLPSLPTFGCCVSFYWLIQFPTIHVVIIFLHTT